MKNETPSLGYFRLSLWDSFTILSLTPMDSEIFNATVEPSQEHFHQIAAISAGQWIAFPQKG